MQDSIENILANRFNKEELSAFINKHPHEFENAVTIALSDNHPLAWRAAWLLSNSIEKNDSRIQVQINNIIKVIKFKMDGHQRELLKILEKMKIDEDQEGQLFDVCMTIWEGINKTPSVRIVAFRIIVKIAKKYPELKDEIEYLTQRHYSETLSEGIKRSFERLKNELFINSTEKD